MFVHLSLWVGGVLFLFLGFARDGLGIKNQMSPSLRSVLSLSLGKCKSVTPENGRECNARCVCSSQVTDNVNKRSDQLWTILWGWGGRVCGEGGGGGGEVGSISGGSRL